MYFTNRAKTEIEHITILPATIEVAIETPITIVVTTEKIKKVLIWKAQLTYG